MAASHTVFFIVAAAMFLPIVGGLFLFIEDVGDSQTNPAAGLDARAASALQHITTSSGLRQDGSSSYWENMGINLQVQEVGIKDENASMISYAKIANLQRGGLVADPTDPFLNYPEFKSALRIGSDVDFHMRLSPVITSGAADPLGKRPLEGYHVAYIANLTNAPETYYHEVNQVSNAYTQPSAVAQAEIDALKALKLRTESNELNGFDGVWYQPVNLDPLLYPTHSYDNPTRINGDVIADSARLYRDTVTGGTVKPYYDWFWDDYFVLPTGEYRFDAVIFGGDVNLDRWEADGKGTRHLQGFLNNTGVVIFMGGPTAGPAGFVNECHGNNGARCLFYPTGSAQAPTTPDVTNQMLTIPNKLPIDDYGDRAKWSICDNTGVGAPVSGVHEVQGFIPITPNKKWEDPIPKCQEVTFGATTSDRYGAIGGTVILTDWDLDAPAVSDKDRQVAFVNLLSYGLLRPVYLDYGPEIPGNAPVASSERLMIVQFPTGEYMDVKVLFYTWKT